MVYQGCDQEYAEQVTAEQKVMDKSGAERWVPKRVNGDNHYLDCEVYAAAAADLMGVRFLGMEAEDAPSGKHGGEPPGEKQSPKQKPPEQDGAPEERWIAENENWLTGGN